MKLRRLGWRVFLVSGLSVAALTVGIHKRAAAVATRLETERVTAVASSTPHAQQGETR
jgi:hypothetical protein